jgi:hypothetical protein
VVSDFGDGWLRTSFKNARPCNADEISVISDTSWTPADGVLESSEFAAESGRERPVRFGAARRFDESDETDFADDGFDRDLRISTFLSFA